jgi:uncharacterized membrane protein YdcZ (DUF606 family)
LTGFPFMTVIITLPQRFQIVNGLSPVAAGIRMLPLLLLTGVGAAFTGILCSKKNVSFYLLVASLCLQIVGTALLSILPTDEAIRSSQYGIQVILGFSFGVGLVSLIICCRVEVELEDHAVAIGAITQVRVLGGVIGLAIVQATLIADLKSRLAGILTPQQLSGVLASTERIALLPPEEARITRHVYGEAANRQMRIVMGFAIAGLLVSLFGWRRHAVEFKDLVRQTPNPPAESQERGPTEIEMENRDIGTKEGEEKVDQSKAHDGLPRAQADYLDP